MKASKNTVRNSLSVAVFLALNALPLSAATEFEDSVPLDLVKVFLGNLGIGEPLLYSDIMDDFPPFTLPAGFAVRGSIDQVYAQRANRSG
jgi:hypothetical protein